MAGGRKHNEFLQECGTKMLFSIAWSIHLKHSDFSSLFYSIHTHRIHALDAQKHVPDSGDGL